MKIKQIVLLFMLFLVVTSFIGCEHIFLNFRLKHSEVIEKKIEIKKGDLINVENVNGTINVSTHDRGFVLIKAEKFSNKKKYLDLIKLHFDSKEDGLYLYSKREKKRMKFKINYTIFVPIGLKRLELSSTNGAIKVKGELSSIDFSTTNGSIKVKGSFENGDLSTTNGSIKAIQSNMIKGDLRMRTTNGSIKLTLHEESSFKLKGRTTNGSISCDFPVKINKRITSSKINGEVGDGQYKVSLSTTNGSIRIYKK